MSGETAIEGLAQQRGLVVLRTAPWGPKRRRSRLPAASRAPPQGSEALDLEAVDGAGERRQNRELPCWSASGRRPKSAGPGPRADRGRRGPCSSRDRHRASGRRRDPPEGRRYRRPAAGRCARRRSRRAGWPRSGRWRRRSRCWPSGVSASSNRWRALSGAGACS